MQLGPVRCTVTLIHHSNLAQCVQIKQACFSSFGLFFFFLYCSSLFLCIYLFVYTLFLQSVGHDFGLFCTFHSISFCLLQVFHLPVFGFAAIWYPTSQTNSILRKHVVLPKSKSAYFILSFAKGSWHMTAERPIY